MSKLVRAKHPTTGATFTTSEARAKARGLKYTEKGAIDQWGRIRPATPAARTNVTADATRAELEQAARDAGLDDQAIQSARTKADLTQAIEAATSTQEV